MTIFLTPLAAGLVGLAALALPVLRRHSPRAGRCAHGAARLLPEPRSVFSFLAFYGALGVALERSTLSTTGSALAALVTAAALEAVVARPLYRLLLGFEGRPSSPLDALASERAVALTDFKNGRGIVEAIRDGRSIQLVASLVSHQRSRPIRVGERLVIVAVDAERQGVTVSL